MKFILMMQGDLRGWERLASWKPEEFQAHIRFMKDLNAELRAAGELVAAEGLDAPTNCRVVTAPPAGGPPVVSDGPFAETKEFLAGFWIVDVPSIERAIEIAGRASSAPGIGGKPVRVPIEIRQVMQAPDCH